MNIQIFGTTKCFDTKKAQRYFKERGIKFQMIDLKEKEMSRGEFENVSRALGGWQALVNPNAKDKQTLALLDALVDWQKEDKLFENQQLFRTPIVRNGRQATVGYQPDVWKSWDREAVFITIVHHLGGLFAGILRCFPLRSAKDCCGKSPCLPAKSFAHLAHSGYKNSF